MSGAFYIHTPLVQGILQFSVVTRLSLSRLALGQAALLPSVGVDAVEDLQPVVWWDAVGHAVSFSGLAARCLRLQVLWPDPRPWSRSAFSFFFATHVCRHV